MENIITAANVEVATSSTASNEDAEQMAVELREQFIRRFTFAGVPPHDAEDLAQQCVLDVLTMSHTVDEERGTLNSWASGVARNNLRTFWRRSKIRRAQEIATDDLQPSVADQVIETDAHFAISEAIQGLSTVDQELLQMRFTLGLSFADIATAADITELAARKRVSRAVEQLRRHPAIQEII